MLPLHPIQILGHLCQHLIICSLLHQPIQGQLCRLQILLQVLCVLLIVEQLPLQKQYLLGLGQRCQVYCLRSVSEMLIHSLPLDALIISYLILTIITCAIKSHPQGKNNVI